jgi:VCBS repeat-containing protein
VSRVVPTAAVLAAVGCGGNDLTLPNTGVPAKLEKVAGDQQTAAAGTNVTTPPSVKVSDASGNPVKDVAVTFRATGGGGAVAPATPVPTDASGVAALSSWTLGSTPGPNQVTASIAASNVSGNPAVFAATGIVGNGNKLVFVVQPSNTSVRQPITPPVQVQVQDAAGNPVTTAADKITVALGTNPGGATLSGTTSVNAVSGTATFSNLTLNKGGNGYTLTALGSGLVSATSAPFNVGNPAPTAASDAYATNEDVPLNVPAPGVLGNDSDPNGDPITAMKLTDPTHGSLTLNANGSFTYTPQANVNGSDSFTYAANDGTQNSSPATVTITVNAVNDPPSFTAGPNQTTTGLQTVTVPGWATNISPGPNEAGQTVSFTVTNDNNGAFIQQPAVDGAGTLTFQTGVVVATVTCTVVAQDNGGTGNGGQDTSAPQQFTITINP